MNNINENIKLQILLTLQEIIKNTNSCYINIDDSFDGGHNLVDYDSLILTLTKEVENLSKKINNE